MSSSSSSSGGESSSSSSSSSSYSRAPSDELLGSDSNIVGCSSVRDEQEFQKRITGDQAGSSSALASLSNVGASTSSGRQGPVSQSLHEVDEAFISSLSGSPSTCTLEELKDLQLGTVDVIIPGIDDRPWRAPEGYFTVYEGYFLCGLSFPLPGLLLDYCDKKKVALSQLAPSSVNNMLMLQKLGRACGVEIDLPFLEGVTSLSGVMGDPSLYYVKMKPGCGIICGAPNKIKDWKLRFFYVKKNEASLLDSQRAIRNCWSRDVGS